MSSPVTSATPRHTILRLGKVVQQARIADLNDVGDPSWDMEVWVIDVR